MCLFVPPKPKKAAKAKDQPKQAPMRPIPKYSRMPARVCCDAATSAVHQQADDLVDFLQQQYPEDYGMVRHYTTQAGLHRLDDTLHAHANQNQKATEAVGEGVKDIQDRLGKMEETLKGAEEAANATWDFCEDDRRRRAQKMEDKRRNVEEESKTEIERLERLVGKSGPKEQEEKKGLGETEVLKLLEEREMRLELGRLRQKEKEMERKTDDFISEARLRQIFDQREQEKDAPRKWLERPDLDKILDQRDREREFTRLQKVEHDKSTSSIKQEELLSQEQLLRKAMEDHDKCREFERLKSVEAEALKHKTRRPVESAHPGLSEVEQLVEDILQRHERYRDRERSRESLRSNHRRQGPLRSSGGESQTTIAEILSLLLHRRSVEHAADVLQSVLHRVESTTPRMDNRDSDRQWILTEVKRSFERLLMDRPRENDQHESYPQCHIKGNCRYGCGTNHSSVHPHIQTSPPPSYRDTTGTRHWSPEQPHVRFAQAPKPAPAYWERSIPMEHGQRQR